jgi:uncharacterized membrane protein HdeD (DUF308 family)/pimeloyl-ACP methyl ester carboxylesterase
VTLAVGGVTIALGVILALNATASIQLLSILVGVGLVLFAATRVVSLTNSTVAWLEILVTILIIALAIVTFVWRGTTVPFLAFSLAIILVVSGIVGIIGGFRGTRDERFSSVVVGLASVLAAAAVFFWPKLTVYLVAVLFGVWLVFLGSRLVINTLLTQRRADREPYEDLASVQQGPGRIRRGVHAVGAVAALLVAVLVLTGTVLIRSGDPAIVPDAFYTPPVSVPSEPGALIRIERMTIGVPDGTQAWRILYTTTDQNGKPAVSSGTVIAPAVLPDGPLPVLAIAHGTTGVVPGCAPSLMPEPFSNGAGEALKSLVDEGWVGVTSDYVGLGTAGPHAYLVGTAEAHSVLDSVRAAHHIGELNLGESTLVWGHSQGGHGALWTGLLAADYAPEFDIIGVAATAPAANLTALADGIKDTAVGKIVSSYIAVSWSEVYGFDMGSVVSPGYAPSVRGIAQKCFDTMDALANLLAGTQLSGRIFLDSAIEGRTGDLLKENTPTGQITAPLLIAQGEADQLVLPEVQKEFVKNWCAEGQDIDFRLFPGLDHLPLVAPGSPLNPELVDWARARLAGDPPTPNC